MATIRQLDETPADHALGLALVREYIDATAVELGVPLEEILPFVPDYDEFPGRYHPDGAFLVAEVNGEPAGSVGIAPIGGGRCEMNRLWVRPGFRQLGLGRELVLASLAQASRLGYWNMALEVAISRTRAIELYRSLGFTECPLYHDFTFPMMAMSRDLEENS
jgi:carbonic anhydrase